MEAIGHDFNPLLTGGGVIPWLHSPSFLLPPKPLVVLNELQQQHTQGLALHITQWNVTATDVLTRKVPPTKHEP